MTQTIGELVAAVRRNATVDWDKKEQVGHRCADISGDSWSSYRYPPDKQESAIVLS